MSLAVSRNKLEGLKDLAPKLCLNKRPEGCSDANNGTIEGKYNNIICHMCMLHVDLVIVSGWRNKVKAGAVACCHSSGCK